MQRKNNFRYTELANHLREQITSGQIKPGQFLMSENELCKHYGMSRITVRKSLELLQEEGLLIKKAGQGSMVPSHLATQKSGRKVLRISSVAPSYYNDQCMPIIVKHFCERYPDTDVQILDVPSSDFHQLMMNHPDIQYQPDIMLSGHDYFSTRQSERFADLRPLVDEENYALIYSRLTDEARRSGKIATVPVSFSPIYLAYNPLLFKHYGIPEPNGTWEKEDFIRAAQKLTIDTNGDGIIDLYGFSLRSDISRWAAIALRFGFDFDFETTENLNLLEETLVFIHDLLYRYRITSLKEVDEASIEFHPFYQQKVAMMLTTSFVLAGMRAKGLSFEPKAARLPFSARPVTTMISNELAIPFGSEQPALAGQFIRTALDPDIQEQIARETGFFSVYPQINEKVWGREYLDKLNMNTDQMNNNVFVNDLIPSVPSLELMDSMKLYWSGMETARECAVRMKEMAMKSKERTALTVRKDGK